ncbi:cytochrome P450 [Paraburkholderia strydomiana]|jgi:cytochrome P450|uniref:Cytochrome P450 n=1 Tax=Paraburkholderia strydomiana TaxID=1245417 RepID=A0ABW9EPK3_9BURK
MLLTQPRTLASKTLLELLTDPADDRDALYSGLSAAAPVYRDPSGAWMVSTYRLSRAILNHPALSSRSPLVATGVLDDEAGILEMMLFQDDADHHRLRHAFAPLFSKTRLSSLRDGLRADLDALLASLPDPHRFDLMAYIAQRLPSMTICRLIGLDVAHAPELVAGSMSAIRLISAAPLRPDERREAIRRTVAFMRDLESHMPAVRELLRTAPATPAERPPQDRELTPHQLLVNVLLMFIAGYGTTMLSIGNTLRHALACPGLWQRLAGEPTLVPAAIRELMRLEPAVHLLFRYARHAVEFDGLTLAPGDAVAIVAAAANRDPAEFDMPSQVRPERAHNGLVFGAGMHGCIGVPLARMQLEVVFDTLLARMPRLTLESARNPRLQEGSFRGYRTLWLRDQAARAGK